MSAEEQGREIRPCSFVLLSRRGACLAVRTAPYDDPHAGETMSARTLLRMLAYAALLTLPGCLVVTCGP